MILHLRLTINVQIAFRELPQLCQSDSFEAALSVFLLLNYISCSTLESFFQNWQVSLSGHLFDQFLINEALDIIEAAGGSFHLVKCQVGQSADAMSYSELEVSLQLPLPLFVVG